ncbi:hypothetical protein EDB81DRAFT_907762 [Dactylonectria macrodidyma]|uniref:RRM domain-containing protein n=1 Tax=Dactylonectria macrodidyma TaxID=307937 RepID=A0A9P9DYS7_9HYPO|nr:hypothetical protein EDB81DRAFT_907762 [Dactylonectria macrodidyma]
MARRNAEFENKIEVARRSGRLLSAHGIDYRAPLAAFQSACLNRFSDPGTVKFFWRETDAAWKRNPGFAMIEFESITHRDRAFAELEGFVFRGRPVTPKVASKRAHQPFHLRTQSAASTSAAPTTTTTTTTTIAEDLPTAASTIAAPTAATAASTTPTTVAATSAAPLTATPTTTLAVGPDLPAPTIAASTTAAPIAWQANRSSRVNRPFIIDFDDEDPLATAPTPITRQRSRGSRVGKQFIIDISDDTDDSQ